MDPVVGMDPIPLELPGVCAPPHRDDDLCKDVRGNIVALHNLRLGGR